MVIVLTKGAQAWDIHDRFIERSISVGDLRAEPKNSYVLSVRVTWGLNQNIHMYKVLGWLEDWTKKIHMYKVTLKC